MPGNHIPKRTKSERVFCHKAYCSVRINEKQSSGVVLLVCACFFLGFGLPGGARARKYGGLEFLSTFGPALAAFLVGGVTEGRNGIKKLLQSLFQWRVRWVWYLVVLFGPALTMTVAILLYTIMTANQYDAIVIGAAITVYLVAAAYLARAGKKVVVLERREIVGGAAVTEEIFPGFKFTEFSYVVSLLRPEIIRELELPKHGLKILPLPSTFHADGKWGLPRPVGRPRPDAPRVVPSLAQRRRSL
jgi:hypothetical protein